MENATRTLSVNAAFLAEIKDDHRELHELLAQTEGWLEQAVAWPNHAAEITLLLDRLRDQMALHFSLEEAYGYLESSLEVAPQLSERAFRLREEHGPLYQEIVSLAVAAARVVYHERAPGRMTGVAERVAEFCRRFKQHEECEGDLIMDALGSDLGVGD